MISKSKLTLKLANLLTAGASLFYHLSPNASSKSVSTLNLNLTQNFQLQLGMEMSCSTGNTKRGKCYRLTSHQSLFKMKFHVSLYQAKVTRQAYFWHKAHRSKEFQGREKNSLKSIQVMQNRLVNCMFKV